MEQSKIDFNNIASLKYSNRSHSQEENYTNENILLFGDEDIEMDKNDIKKNNKKLFDEILNKTKIKYKSLSDHVENIINNKNFSFQKFLANNLNIQSIIVEGKNKVNNNFNLINNKTNNNLNNNNINNNINLKINNHFKIIEPLNIDNTQKNIFKQNSGEISPKLIGKKRKQENTINDNNKETTEQEKKIIFNDILIICQEISNLNNDIIKKEEQNSVNTDNDNIETTLIINDSPLATIYLNKDIVNKIYVFKNKKNLIKENEIISQLKQIKKNMTLILNQLKKKKTF